LVALQSFLVTMTYTTVAPAMTAVAMALTMAANSMMASMVRSSGFGSGAARPATVEPLTEEVDLVAERLDIWSSDGPRGRLADQV
jgi:hypothetical protein